MSKWFWLSGLSCGYLSHANWQEAVAKSSVRLQWDPGHHPSAAKQERRAVQLGLRGDVLARYAREGVVGIEDISKLVPQRWFAEIVGVIACSRRL